MMGGWDRWGVVDSYRGLGGVRVGGCYVLVRFFLFVFICAFVFCAFLYFWEQMF